MQESVAILQSIRDQLIDAIEHARPLVESKFLTYPTTESGWFQSSVPEELVKEFVLIRDHDSSLQTHDQGYTEATITCWPALDKFARLQKRIEQYMAAGK